MSLLHELLLSSVVCVIVLLLLLLWLIKRIQCACVCGGTYAYACCLLWSTLAFVSHSITAHMQLCTNMYANVLCVFMCYASAIYINCLFCISACGCQTLRRFRGVYLNEYIKIYDTFTHSHQLLLTYAHAYAYTVTHIHLGVHVVVCVYVCRHVGHQRRRLHCENVSLGFWMLPGVSIDMPCSKCAIFLNNCTYASITVEFSV